MSYNMYYILGAVLIVYLLITMANKKTARKRKSRKFMEGYERKDRRGASAKEQPDAKDKGGQKG